MQKHMDNERETGLTEGPLGYILDELQRPHATLPHMVVYTENRAQVGFI